MSALLLEAYDHLRIQHKEYCRRLEISLNEHPEGKRTQDEIRGDWGAFWDEWDDLVEAARARFGSEVVDLVFAHMKITHFDRSSYGKPLWKPGDPEPNPFAPD